MKTFIFNAVNGSCLYQSELLQESGSDSEHDKGKQQNEKEKNEKDKKEEEESFNDDDEVRIVTDFHNMYSP